MSIFDKDTKKSEDTPKEKKTKSSFAFVEDTSLEKKDTKDLEDFISSGRGQGKKSLNPKGRPKLEQDEKREETIVIYLTKEQKELLTDKSKRASLSVSKYVLLKVFGID